MAEKIWDQHVVHSAGGADLLYVDLHLLHEVSSPQAFEGLRTSRRSVRRPELTLATEDHIVPTDGGSLADPVAREQVALLRSNCAQFGIPLMRLGDAGQGIVHVIGPELGLSQPGMTIVCGDSHTSTHGALGALAFGIGTSEVEHVLATQTITQARPKMMSVTVKNELPPGATAKDLALELIASIGSGGGQGHIVEYRGTAVQMLSVEARMTLCNMSIELGARAGLVAPDEQTFRYLKDKAHAPTGKAWREAEQTWQELCTDHAARFDREVVLDGSEVVPFVTWGTAPAQGVPLSGVVPDPRNLAPGPARDSAERALAYMDLKPGTRMRDIAIDAVFIGSCTNSRIEDLRAAAKVLDHRRVADGVRLLVVPGSARVKEQAEREGLDKVFSSAGAQWRGAGCSMCIGLNSDAAQSGQRVVSTSNRNFEGRQGAGARTHLVSPAVAAATAVRGRLTAPGDL